MREPIVAGTFYSADHGELKKEIEEAFSGKFGAGKKQTTKKILAAIAPHAGYYYSGQAASHVYATLKNSKYDTFILLGTNHSGIGRENFLLSQENFLTPLGEVKNDKEFIDMLKKVEDIEINEFAHAREHSIEVQLPFLQVCCKNFNIVPIIVNHSSIEKLAEFAEAIIKTAKKLKRKICVIASSDFTHYGFSYGFTPFTQNVQKNLYALDKRAIDSILKLDTKEFLYQAEQTTICGAYAIALVMEICKLQKAKGELLKYYTSSDISGDYNTAVGYAAIVFS